MRQNVYIPAVAQEPTYSTSLIALHIGSLSKGGLGGSSAAAAPAPNHPKKLARAKDKY
jgi:hypothetical protein